jgi:hypothetical protein
MEWMSREKTKKEKKEKRKKTKTLVFYARDKLVSLNAMQRGLRKI